LNQHRHTLLDAGYSKCSRFRPWPRPSPGIPAPLCTRRITGRFGGNVHKANRLRVVSAAPRIPGVPSVGDFAVHRQRDASCLGTCRVLTRRIYDRSGLTLSLSPRRKRSQVRVGPALGYPLCQRTNPRGLDNPPHQDRGGVRLDREERHGVQVLCSGQRYRSHVRSPPSVDAPFPTAPARTVGSSLCHTSQQLAVSKKRVRAERRQSLLQDPPPTII